MTPIRSLCRWLVAAFVILTGAGLSHAAGVSTLANVVVEIPFHAANPHADPFNTVTLDVNFTDPKGNHFKVPAFWDGGDLWKVRYASGTVGLHQFESECSDAADSGLQHVHGTVSVQPYTGSDPLYRHGPLVVAPDHRHFVQADGTPFLWLGDTWWTSLSKRLKWPDEFATLTADRKAKGFNVVQIIAGLYPEQGPFDPRAENEGGFPWEKNYTHIRPEYFDAADRRIQYLVNQGIVPCIVGAWGYHMEWLGEAKMKQHLRYVAARWGAYPVVFCVAGEFNLPYYKDPGFPLHAEKQLAKWQETIAYFRTVDAFHRLVSAHPTGVGDLSARTHFNIPGLLDFDMLQTGHGRLEVLKPTISTIRESYNAQPPMPVVDAEASYEAIFGGMVPAYIPRLLCWSGYLSGLAGHTYGANGIWQLNRKDSMYYTPVAPPDAVQPFYPGGDYGKTTWDEAMRLPGSRQVGLAKKLLSSFDFENFTPHQEWATWTVPSSDPYLVPYTAGIPGKIRVIYVPKPGAISVHALESGVAYRARRFDPITGQSSDLGLQHPDAQGSLAFDTPAGCDHDWVVIMEASKKAP